MESDTQGDLVTKGLGVMSVFAFSFLYHFTRSNPVEKLETKYCHFPILCPEVLGWINRV